MQRLPLILACALAFGTTALAQGSTARYLVRLEATWSPQTHPGSYPGFAHFSAMTGGSHALGTHFWEEGGLATDGLEQLAENGDTGFLRSEVFDAIAAGTAGSAYLGPAALSPGEATTLITVSEEFPLATLVTMIAPSPDWFVGTQGLPLFQNGRWRDEITVDLIAWDSGTDSGADFDVPNHNTNPAQPIHRITTGPLGGLPPLGTFTFTRVASTWTFGCGGNPDGSMTVEGLPTLGSTVSFTLADPLDVFPGTFASVLTLSPNPAPEFPCGRHLPGFGLFGPGQGSELLVGGPARLMRGPISGGAPVTISVPIPNHPGLVGRTLYAQGALIDAAGRRGLTEAVELLIGE